MKGRKRCNYKVFKASRKFLETADIDQIKGLAFSTLMEYYNICGSKEYQAFIRSNRSIFYDTRDKKHYPFLEAMKEKGKFEVEYKEN